MPTRVPIRRADRRLAEHTGRLTAAAGDKSRLNAVVGWLMAEFYKTRPERRPHWMDRMQRLAVEMNEEARHDAQ